MNEIEIKIKQNLKYMNNVIPEMNDWNTTMRKNSFRSLRFCYQQEQSIQILNLKKMNQFDLHRENHLLLYQNQHAQIKAEHILTA